jgi:hypothetical protein
MNTFRTMMLGLVLALGMCAVSAPAYAMNTPKSVVARVTIGGDTAPTSAVAIQVTDQNGQVASMQTVSDDGIVYYDGTTGLITIVMANFKHQWVEGEQLIIDIMTKAGVQAQAVITIDAAILQDFTRDTGLNIRL